MAELNYSQIESKWQKAWQKAKLEVSRPKKGQKKFYLIFAYPGPSGFLHVGHMRGFSYADIITRFKRMQGYNVLFPAGIHASGITAVAYAGKIKKGDSSTIEQLKDFGKNDKQIKELENPEKVVHFFKKVYFDEFWKKFGFLIDETRVLTTIDPAYRKFIEWQFRKLKEKNMLVQKPHYGSFCPQDGFVAVDSSETDISQGGNAETMEYTILKFKCGEYILPAATLRPETVFGVTNIWINPDKELVEVQVGKEKWLMTEHAARRLTEQKENITISGQKIAPKKLIGEFCENLAVGGGIPILPSSFVQEDIGTGIVMSVPAHAPYDYVALHELQENLEELKKFNIPEKTVRDIKLVSLIQTQGFGDFPAQELAEKMRIEQTSQKELLDKATEEVYKAEFHAGVLKSLYGKFAGLRVSEAKEALQKEFISKNTGDKFYGFSEKVICRCGREVIVKLIPKQWFIKYSDQKIKELSKKHSEKMTIIPDHVKAEFPAIIDWYHDRACVRKGSWLGTEFPIEKGWIIEPIADSTIYPLTYLYSHYLNDGKLKVENLKDEFFDFLFLNKGKAEEVVKATKISKKLLSDIKEEVDYWLPLDVNLGGKEHKKVHFPVYLMNHVMILPEKFWPKGILIHGWMTGKAGSKFSKSKGNAISLHDLASKFSVDALRVYYCHAGSTGVDVEFDEDSAQKYKNALDYIFNRVEQLLDIKGNRKDALLDEWANYTIKNKIRTASAYFDDFNLRDATEILVFELIRDFGWYLNRGGKNKSLIKELMMKWIIALSCITPHLAEEIWHNKLGQKTFVTQQIWNDEKIKIDSNIEESERLIQNILGDVAMIKELSKINSPNKIMIFTAPKWKWKGLQLTKNAIKDKPDFGKIMKELMADPELKKHGNEIPGFAKQALKTVLAFREIQVVNEGKILKNAIEFFEDKLKTKIEIISAEKSEHPKAKNAFPFKPAILIE